MGKLVHRLCWKIRLGMYEKTFYAYGMTFFSGESRKFIMLDIYLCFR